MPGCHYCGDALKELRPYGPGGALVCVDCAFATDERREQTDNAPSSRCTCGSSCECCCICNDKDYAD